MQRCLIFSALLLASLSSLFAASSVVLPFSNLSRNKNQVDRNLDWIGESIAEMVHEAVSGEGLLVLDRSDRTQAYTRLGIRPYALLTRASVVKIGDELDAHHVVYGSFEVTRQTAPAKSTILIRARVLDLRRLRQSDELVETGPLEDLASLQNRLCYRTLVELLPDARLDQQSFLAKRTRTRIDALENYIRGLLAADPAAKHRFFTQAARLDANFSPPCFQLGLYHWEQDAFREAALWFQRVRSTDSHYRQANFYLGICKYRVADYPAAEQAFQLVASTVPLNEVYNNLGAAQIRRSPSLALDSFLKALEGDQSDPDYHFNAGYALWKIGNFEVAAERFRAALDRVPSDAQAISLLGRCLKKDPARPGDPRTEGLERIKEQYQEAAFLQLQSIFDKK
jgi:tetratricopeptide (TPR) repeat protein